MSITNTREIVDSYINLLIMQYVNKPKATAFINTIASPALVPQTSVQTIAFSSAPSSGTFVLDYNGSTTAAINWNDSAATIQTKLQAISGLSSITVSGSIASLLLTITFTGVMAPAYVLSVSSSTLTPTITITETDVTLPLAVQGAFDFSGTYAQGVQLDVIGKYVGAFRTGTGFAGSAVITLNDTDFISLIQMAIIKNQAGSSLATIQQYLNRFFPAGIYVTDHANMTMTYVVAASLGSNNLIQLFVTEGLLPAPMGVELTTIYVPYATVFSFRTYELANTVGAPFNTYSNYKTVWPWISYSNVVA